MFSYVKTAWIYAVVIFSLEKLCEIVTYLIYNITVSYYFDLGFCCYIVLYALVTVLLPPPLPRGLLDISTISLFSFSSGSLTSHLVLCNSSNHDNVGTSQLPQYLGPVFIGGGGDFTTIHYIWLKRDGVIYRYFIFLNTCRIHNSF